jgi:hypothetical protein
MMRSLFDSNRTLINRNRGAVIVSDRVVPDIHVRGSSSSLAYEFETSRSFDVTARLIVACLDEVVFVLACTGRVPWSWDEAISLASVQADRIRALKN